MSSFPRKRESSLPLWTPACAGVTGNSENQEVIMPDRRPFDPHRRALLGSFGAWLAASALPFPAFAQSGGAAKSRIGVIGAGRIGGTVGSLWVKAGHEVMFSSRHPEELKDLVAGLGPLA